jgi:hypothetical protein
MDRRKFLQRLGLGAAVAAVAPSAVEAVCSCARGSKPLIGTAEEWCDIHGTPLVECRPVLAEYAEYTDFSGFANCGAIDEGVMKAAEELGRSAGEHLSYLSSREGLEAAGW